MPAPFSACEKVFLFLTAFCSHGCHPWNRSIFDLRKPAVFFQKNLLYSSRFLNNRFKKQERKTAACFRK